MLSSERPNSSTAYRTAILLLGLLVLVDVLFVLGDLFFNVILDGTRPNLRVTEDRTFPEFFQYTKFVWILALLVVIARTRRVWRYLALVPSFAYLLLDDSLSIHERGGAILAYHAGFAPALGLRAVDFGELIVSAIAGVLALGSIAIGAIRARPAVLRFFTDIVLLVALTAVFGVVVDMFHILVDGTGGEIIGLIEDGGEMLSVSVITAYMFHVALGGSAFGWFWRRRSDSDHSEPSNAPRQKDPAIGV